MGKRKKQKTSAGIGLVSLGALLLIAAGVVTVHLAEVRRADQVPAIAWAFVGFAIVALVAGLFLLGVIDHARAGKGDAGMSVGKGQADEKDVGEIWIKPPTDVLPDAPRKHERGSDERDGEDASTGS